MIYSIRKKYTYYFDYSNNVVKDALNGWTKTNKNTGIPIMKTQNTSGGNSLPSEFYVEDGSYLRLKNLQLGYSLPKKVVGSDSIQQTARVCRRTESVYAYQIFRLRPRS